MGELIDIGAGAVQEKMDRYGNPVDRMRAIAKAWSSLLGYEVTPAQVCCCMILLKIEREAHYPDAENRKDILGYREILHRLGPDDR